MTMAMTAMTVATTTMTMIINCWHTCTWFSIVWYIYD